MLIVNPSDTCDDPKVLTGSHNWSVSANEYNDENTVIIHNDTIANLYLQYFKASFNNLAGSSMSTPPYNCNPITTQASSIATLNNNVFIYPNPSSDGEIFICYELSSAQNINIDIYNVTGQKIASLMNGTEQGAGRHSCNYTLSIPGIYFIQVTAGIETFTRKTLVAE